MKKVKAKKETQIRIQKPSIGFKILDAFFNILTTASLLSVCALGVGMSWNSDGAFSLLMGIIALGAALMLILHTMASSEESYDRGWKDAEHFYGK